MENIRSIRLTKEEIEMIEDARAVLAARSMGVKVSQHATMQMLLKRGLGAFFEGQACSIEQNNHAEACSSKTG